MKDIDWALRFTSYFDVADELADELTLDDLDSRFVEEAKQSADENGLSWPPRLAEAEEFQLSNLQVLRSLLS